jgi:hypothetical protein
MVKRKAPPIFNALGFFKRDNLSYKERLVIFDTLRSQVSESFIDIE